VSKNQRNGGRERREDVRMEKGILEVCSQRIISNVKAQMLKEQISNIS
jgi:GTP:adenosylcobinamide-phosphate guanylyltransferase